MPDIFDLSNVGNNSPGAPKRPESAYAPDPPSGTGLPIDDVARKIVYVCSVVGGIAFLYLMWGVFGGSWANPDYKALTHQDHLRIVSNIATFSGGLRLASIVGMIALLICAFRDEYVGYVLAGIALFFYTGVELAADQAFSMRGLSPSSATGSVFAELKQLSYIYGVPGAVLIVVDFGRRFKVASDNAAMQRAISRYGSGAQTEKKSRNANVFSRCWEMPYCREHVRVKCPVYIKRMGPCWWHKQGCMCEERIVLQSVIDTNWREKSLKATPMGMTAGTSLSDGMNTQHVRALSPAAKRERCRNCVIYNEHERQKYKALVAVTILALVGFLAFFSSQAQDATIWLLASLERVSEKLSFGSADSGGISFLHGHPSALIEWFVIIIGCLFGLSLVLRFIEYCCFKIKI